MNTLTRYTLSAVLLISARIVAAADNVITITNEAQFNKEILQSGKPAVVKVGAKWCPACTGSEAAFHNLSNDFPTIVFASLDSDQNDKLATQYKVKSLPTLLYFNKGKLVSSKVGYKKDLVVDTLRSMQSAPASEEKKSPAQEKVMPAQEQPKEAPSIAEPQKTEEAAVAAPAPACDVQSESFFSRAYQSTKDFFANLGETIKSWFR